MFEITNSCLWFFCVFLATTGGQLWRPHVTSFVLLISGRNNNTPREDPQILRKNTLIKYHATTSGPALEISLPKWWSTSTWFFDLNSSTDKTVGFPPTNPRSDSFLACTDILPLVCGASRTLTTWRRLWCWETAITQYLSHPVSNLRLFHREEP